MINTTLQKIFYSNNLNETEQFACSIAKNIQGGELIILNGDLGSGKTSFVRGFVLSLGSDDTVSSPSFTIRNDYVTKKVRVAHYDFYRLTDPGILLNGLIETIGDKQFVTIIEWSDIVNQQLDQPKITIIFENISIDQRKIIIVADKSLDYLINGL